MFQQSLGHTKQDHTWNHRSIDHLMVQFGRQRRKVTIRISCDAGFDQRTLMFALNRAYDVVEVETGHVVEKVTVRTIEKHRHFHGVSLDSVVKCMTIRAFEDFLDRVYEKKDGSGVRVERKISRDLEVEELVEMLQKGAPAFETAYSMLELNQTVGKMIRALQHVAVRQATLEDQMNSMTKSVTELVDSLTKLMQPKEAAPREEPTPRDQVPFYS